ncbi:hypothetical protein HpKG121_29520 [Helicobacter pylori]
MKNFFTKPQVNSKTLEGIFLSLNTTNKYDLKNKYGALKRISFEGAVEEK